MLQSQRLNTNENDLIFDPVSLLSHLDSVVALGLFFSFQIRQFQD